MDELNTVLIQTGFNIERLKEDEKIDQEAYAVLKERNNLALNLSSVSNRRELLIAFMEHYRDNDGMGKRDSEAIDAFLNSN